jgi:hypothetical protein
MARRRTYTEMIGTVLTKADYLIFKEEMRRRRMTTAEFLRQRAVMPLLAELAQQAEVQDGQQN